MNLAKVLMIFLLACNSYEAKLMFLILFERILRMLRCMLHVEINIAFTNFGWPCMMILSLFMCNFYIVLLFPLWTLPSLNLFMLRLDHKLCAFNLVIHCWLRRHLLLHHSSQSILTSHALLDFLISLALTVIIGIVNVKGTLLRSVGLREYLMHPQQQLPILKMVPSPAAPSLVAPFG
jgi:hypothetical protein